MFLEVINRGSDKELKCKITLRRLLIDQNDNKIIINENNKIDIEMSCQGVKHFAIINKLKKNLLCISLNGNIVFIDTKTFKINRIFGYKGYELSKNLISKNILILYGINSNTSIVYDFINHKELYRFEKENYSGIIDNILVTEEYKNNCSDQRALKIYKLLTDDDIPDEEKCVICFNRTKKNQALVPCGHTQYCEDCINKIKKCSLCKTPIDKIIKIFM